MRIYWVTVNSTWSNSWTIDNTNPVTPASAGWEIQLDQQLVTGGNQSVVFTDGWNQWNDIVCNQTWTITNQAWSCDCANQKTHCHQPMAPGTQFQYQCQLFCGSGTLSLGVWSNGYTTSSSGYSASGC
jgi:hypothetical protein